MPYSSKAQARYMHAKHPEIAKKWDKKMSKSAWAGLSEKKRKK